MSIYSHRLQHGATAYRQGRDVKAVSLAVRKDDRKRCNGEIQTTLLRPLLEDSAIPHCIQFVG
jgi:hypothetical protein